MKWLKWIILLAVVIFLMLFIAATDFNKVLASLQQVGAKFIIILLSTFIAYMAATIGWRYCMGKKAAAISAWQLFVIRHIGETAGVVNPTGIVGGEALKIILLRKKNIEPQTVVVSVIISRLLMVLTQLLMFFVALAYLTSTSTLYVPFFNAQNGLVFITIVGLLFWGWAVFTSNRFKRLVRAIPVFTKPVFWLATLNNRRRHWLRLFSQFLISHPRVVAWAGFYFMLHWLVGSLEFYFILTFLGIKVTVVKALLIDMGVIFFKAAGTFIPGQVGIEEYGNKIMLATIGITDNEIWITASILRRTRQLFWIGIGVLFYLLLQKSNPAINDEVKEEAKTLQQEEEIG